MTTPPDETDKLAQLEKVNDDIFDDIKQAREHIHALTCAANQAKITAKKAKGRIRKATKAAHDAQRLIDSAKANPHPT